MKVTDVQTFIVGNPPPHFGGRYFIFVKLTTDSGISGIGEIYAATFSAQTVARMIEDVAEREAARALVGDRHDVPVGGAEGLVRAHHQRLHLARIEGREGLTDDGGGPSDEG